MRSCRDRFPWVNRRAFFAGVLSGALAVTSMTAAMTSAGAQSGQQVPASHPPLMLYVQAADARFDSYLYVKRNLSPNQETESLDELFVIPHPRSKEREREFVAWRRQFRVIMSAATFSETAQAKISHVKEEFRQASNASECWSIDYNRERRITVTIIGSASESVIKNEYEAVSRLFLANPINFTCKYAGQPTH